MTSSLQISLCSVKPFIQSVPTNYWPIANRWLLLHALLTNQYKVTDKIETLDGNVKHSTSLGRKNPHCDKLDYGETICLGVVCYLFWSRKWRRLFDSRHGRAYRCLPLSSNVEAGFGKAKRSRHTANQPTRSIVPWRVCSFSCRVVWLS